MYSQNYPNGLINLSNSGHFQLELLEWADTPAEFWSFTTKGGAEMAGLAGPYVVLSSNPSQSGHVFR